MKILFTGGGTGGHLFPLISIARELRRMRSNNDLELFYIGPKDEFGLILLSQEDFKIKTTMGGKLRRYFSFQNIVDILFKIPFGFLQSLYYLITLRPKIVFSKGGSGSIAVVYAARLLGIPVFLHESDIVPGLSNRYAFKFAKKIFISFPKTEYFDLSKTILTGNPIRTELLNGDKEKAKDLFSLNFSKPIILFLGGSQGAQYINDFVLDILNDLLKEFEVIHVAGRENVRQVQAESQVVIDKNLETDYHVIGFLDEEKLKHAYKASDLIVSRAGSGSIFEIAAVGKPSILVPLPGSAGNHQAKNAFAYAATGAGLILEQENLKKNFFLEKFHSIIKNPEKMQKMHEEALRFSKPLAGKAIAREILEYLLVI